MWTDQLGGRIGHNVDTWICITMTTLASLSPFLPFCHQCCNINATLMNSLGVLWLYNSTGYPFCEDGGCRWASNQKLNFRTNLLFPHSHSLHPSLPRSESATNFGSKHIVRIVIRISLGRRDTTTKVPQQPFHLTTQLEVDAAVQVR